MLNKSLIRFESLADGTVDLIKWKTFQSTLTLAFLGLCLIINLGGKCYFIYYFWKFAPKNRPFNEMFVKDQVSNFLFPNRGLFLILFLIKGRPTHHKLNFFLLHHYLFGLWPSLRTTFWFRNLLDLLVFYCLSQHKSCDGKFWNGLF